MKYRLKKQLYDLSTEIEYSDFVQVLIPELRTYVIATPDKLPDYFEPIPSRWKPKEGEIVYVVDSMLIVDQFRYEKTAELDDDMLKIGNMFQTCEQAERASLKIKEALEEFWKNLKPRDCICKYHIKSDENCWSKKSQTFSTDCECSACHTSYLLT